MSKGPAGRLVRAATLADVGREAGVSAMTASAVLNGSASSSTRIAPDTRDRVLAAAAELQYRPNRMARGLADRRLNCLGLVANLSGEEPNLYFLEVFNGIVHAAAERGQNVTVFTLPVWEGAAPKIGQFCDGRIDGLILLAPMFDPSGVLPDHTPMVSIHGNYPLPNIPNLTSDEEGGAFAAVSQMLLMGHRRILHVAGPTGSVGADLRLGGYQRAYREAGLEPPDDHVVRAEFTLEDGRRALEEWLGAHVGESMPTAVFAGSDAIGLGCMGALQARGLRVPADVSLVGFDDTIFARAAQLSTVAQPLAKLGRVAVDRLIQLIDARGKPGAAPTVQSEFLPTAVVDRMTLAAPRRSRVSIG